MKHQNYIPIWDERLFDQIARDCDKFYAEQRRKRMNNIEERFKMAKRIANLRSLPRRNIEEEKELARLVEEYENDMKQIGRKSE